VLKTGLVEEPIALSIPKGLWLLTRSYLLKIQGWVEPDGCSTGASSSIKFNSLCRGGREMCTTIVYQSTAISLLALFLGHFTLSKQNQENSPTEPHLTH